MRKTLLVLSALTLAAFISLPVLAEDVNTNANANASVNANVNAATPAFHPRSIFLSKAQLTAIAGQTLTVTARSKTYTVTVTDKTTLRRRFGGKSNLGEFVVGNTLQVAGKLSAETTIDARAIRNMSIQKVNASFSGAIQSIDAAGQKFVLKPMARKIITVTVSADTKITQAGQAKTFADLQVGMKVTASGVWDRSNDTLTEVKKVVIRSVPAKALDKAVSALGKAEDKLAKLQERIRQLASQLQVQTGQVTVTMGASGFSPKQIRIGKGTTVTFQNTDSAPHWPASAPHPAHTNYPEFDPKQAVAAGASWSFTFNKPGVWSYHDHLNFPSYGFGTVTVVDLEAQANANANVNANTNTSQ